MFLTFDFLEVCCPPQPVALLSTFVAFLRGVGLVKSIFLVGVGVLFGYPGNLFSHPHPNTLNPPNIPHSLFSDKDVEEPPKSLPPALGAWVVPELILLLPDRPFNYHNPSKPQSSPSTALF